MDEKEKLDGLEEELTEDLREEDSEEAKTLEARRLAEVREFLAVFPEAARGQLPQAVWDGVNQGFSLTAAYVRYLRSVADSRARAGSPVPVQTVSPVLAPAPVVSPALAASPARAASLARASAPALVSTGSMRSAGGYDTTRDPFLEGWNS